MCLYKATLIQNTFRIYYYGSMTFGGFPPSYNHGYYLSHCAKPLLQYYTVVPLLREHPPPMKDHVALLVTVFFIITQENNDMNTKIENPRHSMSNTKSTLIRDHHF